MKRRLPQLISHADGSATDAPTSCVRVPRPSIPPHVDRRQFIKLSLAAVALAHLSVPVLAPGDIARAAPTVDETSAIGKKWLKLGGASMVGWPTSEVITTPDQTAQYQHFEQGIILYAADWGAMFISPTVFQKWLSLNDKVDVGNTNLLSYVGFPTADSTATKGLETCHCERGMLVVNTAPHDQAAFVVYGAIYEHYWMVDDIVGLPISEETDAAHGGRYQSFVGGDIYWHPTTGAFAIYGAIRQRWLALGGSNGPLGYPVADEAPVKRDDREIGRSSRFQNGVIYFTPATGAWEVLADIQEVYEVVHGGPLRLDGLGFPISGQRTRSASDVVFNNFQGGVIVQHPEGMFVFRQLELFVERLVGHGCDTITCNNQDLYVYITIRTSQGLDMRVRRPERGDFGSKEKELQERFTLMPDGRVVDGDLQIDILLEGWDADGSSNDDRLGTVTASYTIDTLWGFFAGGTYRDNDFSATFRIRNPLPYDPMQFRQQLFWSFENFATPRLTYDQFAATFRDVDTDESVWFHPFNRLYYEVVYQGCAASGNCFGMSLESVFAHVNRSLYSPPISRFWPDTQAGQELDPTNSIHQATIHEVNIKHGYQVGAACIHWFLSRFITLQDHNPRQCFIDSRQAFARGDYPIIALSDAYFTFSGHVVRPYRWDDRDPNRWIIYIADPNKPATSPNGSYQDDDHPLNTITIDPIENTFTFWHYDDDRWAGTSHGGGRMFMIPFRHLNHQPQTPFWDILGLIVAGTWFILGNGGYMRQISDTSGRTFYEPNLPEVPQRWDDIRQDLSARMPNIARIPSFNTREPRRNLPFELYYARGSGTTYIQEILAPPAAHPTTVYEWVMHSATLSARIQALGSRTIPDIITTRSIYTANKALAITVPPHGVEKTFSWTVAGPVKHRWIELTELVLQPGQSLAIQLSNGGFAVTFDNQGPTTSADVRVQAGPDARPVSAGKLTIEADTTTTFAFDTPSTSLTYTGATPDRGGWLPGPIEITLAAQDYSSKGIAYTEYRSADAPWQRYRGPFRYSETGVTTLYYRSKDKDGNQEVARRTTFKIGAPTAITLVRFTATRVDQHVDVHWVTSNETRTWGFHLYRGKTDRLSVARQITSQPILARGRGQDVSTYRWTDQTVEPGQIHYYWIAEMEDDGTTRYYGPVQLTDAEPSSTHTVYLPIVKP